MAERKPYAKGTKTAIATSEAQIKSMLQREGADAIAVVEGRDRAQVAFQLNGRQIRFTLPLPSRDDERFTTRSVNQYGGRMATSPDTAANLWLQACRERWRQLHLCIKAKLESIASNIETFDEAFLAHVVMEGGQTVGDMVIPEVQSRLAGNPPRPLLPGPGRLS